MIKDFIEKCLLEAKMEYNGFGPYEDFKNAFDEDIFFEYVLNKIETGCPDLYQLSTPHSLYVYCLEMVKGE